MTRDDFQLKLNKILDECGKDVPQGGNRRPFLTYSWKKYKNKSILNLVDVSKFKETRKVMTNRGVWGKYIGLMFQDSRDWYLSRLNDRCRFVDIRGKMEKSS